MSHMTPQRWEATHEYINEVFGREDDALASIMPQAIAQGMPDIAVDAGVGRLLKLLTQTSPGNLAIELGTLAGYSGIWIARGLRPGGRLITIELEPSHADFAQRSFERAGVADRVELRRGAALDELKQLRSELQPGTVDVVFFDAVKVEYPQYWELARPLICPGGLIIIDNALGSNDWWIDQPDHPSRVAVDRVNRALADDPEFDAAAIPLRQGLVIGRRIA